MKTEKEGPVEELKVIWNDFIEGPKSLAKIGWPIIIPIASLIGLVILVAQALL